MDQSTLLHVCIDQAVLQQPRVFKNENTYVAFKDDAIESHDFSTGVTRIPWDDIEDASIESIGQKVLLVLHMKVSTGLKNERSFWTGKNPARPHLNLEPFSPLDREKILDEVNFHIRRFSGRTEEALPHNPLREEREFKEKLEELSPQPWAIYALIGINVAIWLVTLRYGAGFLKAPNDKLFFWGANTTSAVQGGQWWRLLTATFLHNGVVHILMNMAGLYFIGKTVERIYGRYLTVLIYLGSGLMGSALSLYFSARNGISIGASGAVFGMAGAMLVGVYQHRAKLPKAFTKQTMSGMGMYVVYSLVQGFGSSGIDNAAHVGGLIGGCVIAWILPERFDIESFQKMWVSRATSAISAILVAAIALTLMSPKPEVDVGKVIASAPLLERGVKRFDEGMRMLVQVQQDVKSGKMTLRTADDQSRTVHAPIFREVVADLSQVALLPKDPRNLLVKDVLRTAELLSELLAMNSVYKAGSDDPQPANPERRAQIDRELAVLADRIAKETAALQKMQKKN